MIRLALPLIAATLVGCTRETPPEPMPAPGEAAAPGVQCDSTGLEDLIGKPRSDALLAEAQRRSGARTARWLTPDMMVTMEFNGERLNLHLSADGKLASARCG